MDHTLETRHDAHVIPQLKSCSGKEHAMHRETTGLYLFYCNCGYNSGWVAKDDHPTPAEFFAEHGADHLRNVQFRSV